MEEVPSVSRHHGAITEKDGSFYIEAVQERNPLLMDGVRLSYGEKYPLQPGAVLKLGNVSLSFQLIG
jgi:predicted component of type VI protein secretion system